MVEMLHYYLGHLVKELETTNDPRWPGHKLIENTYLIKLIDENNFLVSFPGGINTAALAQEPPKENDRIVFLGDSITAAGVHKSGYVTLSSAAIAKAHPDLNIKVIGAGIGGHKVPDCQKRLDKDVLQKSPPLFSFSRALRRFASATSIMP